MAVSVYYFSGSILPVPYSFGFGVSGGWLLGDTVSGLWNIHSTSFTPISIPSSSYKYSVNSYVSLSGDSLLVSNVGYGLLSLTTGSLNVSAEPISSPLLLSCFNSSSGGYAITISGSAFYQNGTPITGSISKIGTPFWGANSQEQGNNFYSYMGLSGFGKLLFESTYSVTGGVTANVSGLWKSSFASYIPSSSAVLIGGWSPALFSPNSNAVCISASVPAVLLGFSPGLSGGAIQAWGAPSGLAPSGLWAYVNAITGLGLGTSLGVAFASLTGALSVDSTSGLFRAVSYIGGTITQTQTGVLTGTAPYISILRNDIALIPQTSTSSIIALTYSGSTWSVSGQAVSGIPNPAAIQANLNNVGIGFASGLKIIEYTSNWSLVSSISLPFQPTAITLDVNGNYFCAGFGQAALISSGGLLLGSGIFDSNEAFIYGAAYNSLQYWAASSGYIIPLSYQPWQGLGNAIVSPKGSFQTSANSWLNYNGSSWAQNTGTLSLSGLLWYQNTLLAPSISGILELNMASPFSLEYVRAGSSVLYSGSAYTNFSGYGIGNEPCSVGIDLSGNPRIITIQGNMLTINEGNSVSSSTKIWEQGGGMIGILPDSNGNMWGVSSLAPALIETN